MNHLCFVKNTAKKTRQAINWEKIFVKHISAKGLVLSIYKEPSNPTLRK